MWAVCDSLLCTKAHEFDRYAGHCGKVRNIVRGRGSVFLVQVTILMKSFFFFFFFWRGGLTQCSATVYPHTQLITHTHCKVPYFLC